MSAAACVRAVGNARALREAALDAAHALCSAVFASRDALAPLYPGMLSRVCAALREADDARHGARVAVRTACDIPQATRGTHRQELCDSKASRCLRTRPNHLPLPRLRSAGPAVRGASTVGLAGLSLQVSSAVRLAALLASTVLSDDANSVLLPADGVHRLTALHSRFGRVPSAPSDGKADHPPQSPSAIAGSELSLDREWLDQTAAATGRLVPEALRIAARHDAHTVRSAVGEAVRRLLGTCRRTLPARAAVDLITTLAALRADADVQVRPRGLLRRNRPKREQVACAGARGGDTAGRGRRRVEGCGR